MKIKSFKLKLIFSYIFIILVSFGFIALFLDKSLEENSLHNIQSSLISQARLIENQISSENINELINSALFGIAIYGSLWIHKDDKACVIDSFLKIQKKCQKADQ